MSTAVLPRPAVVDDRGHAAWHLAGAEINGEIATTVSGRVRVSLLRPDLTVQTGTFSAAAAHDLANRLQRCLSGALNPSLRELPAYIDALHAAADWADSNNPSRSTR